MIAISLTFQFNSFFNYTDMETVKALQYRVGDKLAKEFLKKLKTKISDTQAK